MFMLFRCLIAASQRVFRLWRRITESGRYKTDSGMQYTPDIGPEMRKGEGKESEEMDWCNCLRSDSGMSDRV